MFDDNKNTILAIALSLVILIAWQYFVAAPQMEQQERARQAQESQSSQTMTAPDAPAPSTPSPGTAGQPTVPGTPAQAVTPDRAATIAATPRVAIDTPALGGSISLKGGRIDDVVLKGYHETVDPKSPPIVLLSPTGSPAPYYAEFGWVGDAGNGPRLPGPDTVWTVQGNGALTPERPLTLSWENGEGLLFKRTYTVDRDYMFRVEQSVENSTGDTVTLYPYALISRHGTPDITGFFVLHEGLIGVLGESGLQEIDYDDVLDDKVITYEGTGGWLGVTDKYWATALIPDQDAAFTARMSAEEPEGGEPRYQTDYLLGARQVAPGGSSSVSANLFAGAKVVELVDGYEERLGIRNFELLIDWGWFYFITKPLFHVIDYFFKLVGNFGVAILIVTVLVKIVFFPLANKSYVSMSRMKLVQPEMMKIRERFKDDRMRQQQEMMALYKREKINPMAGCLPILLQIPVFFALYKVLFVTIEMRHAPFFGWIKDLAAPDPTTIFNLFGLIPWDPPQFLMLGIWPLIMGLTMFIQMRLNPPPPDPTQAMIFNWMPVVFTFLLATFPAGLVIYWAWNNFLSIIQQYVIMRRQGVKVELWDNLRKMLAGRKADADATKSGD